jgi:hypothetical protein
MTAALMEGLKGFNERRRQQKRHILLLLNNETCNPHLELSNVLLARSFHLTQPMDQGVTNCVKLKHQKLVTQSLIVIM